MFSLGSASNHYENTTSLLEFVSVKPLKRIWFVARTVDIRLTANIIYCLASDGETLCISFHCNYLTFVKTSANISTAKP